MNTVQLVLNVQLVGHLVNRRKASANLVTDALETPGHLGGVHRGVHAADLTIQVRQARYFHSPTQTQPELVLDFGMEDDLKKTKQTKWKTTSKQKLN